MKKIRIRQTQLVFQVNRQNGGIRVGEVKIRIGDLAAVMICAEYKRQLEGCEVAFQLMDPVHRSLRADTLFRSTISKFLDSEGPEYGMLDPEAWEVYDPGLLWLASTHYYEKFGSRVIPQICVDDGYTGPNLDWGKYVVFQPLFDPTYNTPRGMSEEFVARFANALVSMFGKRAIVVTDQPDRVHSEIPKITSDSLYDLVSICARSRCFIGGDTGFTHFSALGRVPHIFALYGKNHCVPFSDASCDLCNGDMFYPFATWGQFWNTNFDTRPKIDHSKTVLHFHVLENNQLSQADEDSVLRQVKLVMN